MQTLKILGKMAGLDELVEIKESRGSEVVTELQVQVALHAYGTQDRRYSDVFVRNLAIRYSYFKLFQVMSMCQWGLVK